MAAHSGLPTELVAPVARRVLSLGNLEQTSHSTSQTYNQDGCSVVEEDNDTTGTIVIGIARAHLDMVRRHRRSWSVPAVQDRTSSAPPTYAYSSSIRLPIEGACLTKRASIASTAPDDTGVARSLRESPISGTFESLEDALYAAPQTITDISQETCILGPGITEDGQLSPPEDDALTMLNRIISCVVRSDDTEKSSERRTSNQSSTPTSMSEHRHEGLMTGSRRTSDDDDSGSIRIILDSSVSPQRVSADLTEKSRGSWGHAEAVSAGSTDWQHSCRSRTTTMTRPSSSAIRHHLNDVRANPRNKKIWAVFWLVILMGATIGTVCFIFYNSPFSSLSLSDRAANTTTAIARGTASMSSDHQITSPSPCFTSDWRCNFLNLFNGSSTAHDADSSASTLSVSGSRSLCMLAIVTLAAFY